MPNGDFASWASMLFKQLDQDHIELFWTTCWMMWFARNQLCFSGNDIPWDIIIAQASRIRLDFQEVNQEKKETRGDVAAYWINPDNGWIKINSDAGFSRVNSWRLGFVGRDNDGEVLIAGNKTMNKGLSIIEAEDEALLWALKTTKECGLDSVIAECDNLQLINGLANAELYITEVGDMLNSILSELYIAAKQ
ncbi:uncharacterized protein LOC126656709 [Mercurialis annua]|uniref:uncharacterized protein LOC126656709 n=1 Tax=Mercurialis annua TaxID=3986 RepID=UPI00215F3832|nr:uncharacterized protein LOC126656709 [Mercurialis annua]